MLKIIGDIESYLNFDNYYIINEYNGKDSIGFTLPIDHEGYKDIYEETTIVDTETGQKYLVKAIDEGTQTVNIKAELDLDELSADMHMGYTNDSATVVSTITGVLPDGWTVQDHAYFSHRRTVELEAATPLEVIDACYETYGIVCGFDNMNKVVHIYDPEAGEPQGAYLTDELNLTALNMKGKSSTFATRLYARGKDGMTFSDINNGKDYVDDNTYSDKIISVYWKDERYTVKENLLIDAKKNLAAMAVPQQSYTCTIVDLARAKEQQVGVNDNIYAFLDFELYMPVVLIDRRRKRRVIHRVVQIKRYPYYPENNEITLSTVAPSIQNTVKNVQQQIEKPTSTFNQIKQAEIAQATETITGQLGGNYVVTNNPATGKPNGWAIMDTENTETAQNVWRATAGGIGHSHSGFNGPYDDIALTMDGKINANMITTGQLNANLIKSGRIESVNGMVYFDLDAAELTATKITGINSSDTLEIGEGSETEYGAGLIYKKNGSEKFEIYSSSSAVQMCFNGNTGQTLSANMLNGVAITGGSSSVDVSDGEILIVNHNGGFDNYDQIYLSNNKAEIVVGNTSSGPGIGLILDKSRKEFQFHINGSLVAYIDTNGFHKNG